jgi:hypothetical protein
MKIALDFEFLLTLLDMLERFAWSVICLLMGALMTYSGFNATKEQITQAIIAGLIIWLATSVFKAVSEWKFDKKQNKLEVE